MKTRLKAKKIIIIVIVVVVLIVLSPFIYSEYWLIRDRYTKPGDIVEIIRVNNDSKNEVLRTVKNENGEYEQVVVSRDMREFTEFIGAKFDGNRAIFQLSDGRKSYMTHEYKSRLFFGKFYDYNIFVFSVNTFEEMLADNNRVSV